MSLLIWHPSASIVLLCFLSASSVPLRRWLISASRDFPFNSSRQVDESSMAARTLLLLDSNNDGAIDKSEVTKFAQNQGLDVDMVIREFVDLDQNGDGTLDFTEINLALHDTLGGVTSVIHKAVGTPTEEDQMNTPDTFEPWKNQFDNVTLPVGSPDFASLLPFPSHQDALSERIRQFGKTKTAPREGEQGFADALAQEHHFEARAQSLEQLASDLRANASIIAKRASRRAVKAGATAARSVSERTLEKIQKLENAAKKAESAVASLRVKAQTRLAQADNLMMLAQAAMVDAGLSKQIASVVQGADNPQAD
eukprot:TRINITY_DN55228_c0_g1_i1.p1 TRINITY_DN55228_c0_g1~~TRINITY_DN55228_c0_g1_i1.p1  ORF type:complete len:311 (+),score=58.80 TRINITY_DN55228_c0_g1_i1:58-990(+)